jgi:hypothetical protein
MKSSKSRAISSHSRIFKLLSRTVFAVVLLVSAVYACALVIEWHRQRTVQELIKDVQGLRVDTTTEAEIHQLAQKYHGEYSGPGHRTDSYEPANYVISVWSPGITIGVQKHALPGRRLWGAIAYLPVEKGVLSEVHFGAGVHRADGVALGSDVIMTGEKPRVAPEGVSYFVFQAHVTGPPTESLQVELTPASTPSERKKAFDINLSCFTALRECRHVCEVMPQAWNDLPSGRRIRNSNGGVTDNDSACP